MNNITFGDGSSGYYETVAGGAGAVSYTPGRFWHLHIRAYSIVTLCSVFMNKGYVSCQTRFLMKHIKYIINIYYSMIVLHITPVVMVKPRRNNVVSTSIQRCFNVVWPWHAHWDMFSYYPKETRIFLSIFYFNVTLTLIACCSN